MEVTRTLARYVVNAQSRDIPKSVKHEGARSIVNWLGCAVGAARHEAVECALAALSPFSGPKQASVQQVAEATIRCLKRYVPAAVPGIVFLSGGQSAEDATDHLNAMNAMGPHPWQVSFSYGRALQAPVLSAWKGQESNVAAAQQALLKRSQLNGLARDGKYSRSMEAAA